MTQPIERAQRLICSLPREGLQALLLETDAGRTYQELLALKMIEQDTSAAKIRESHASKSH
jgi:hypothetical protein